MSPRSGAIVFRPRARLLKLIGAELISDDVVAVTELVKNAYDADASTVTITFRAVSIADGEIEIRDDGAGMDAETVLGVWMEPGATSKTGSRGQRTRRGRRVLGEKGVGRFAADKLARHLELISRRAGEQDEIRATFDWDRFDSDVAMLGDVRNRWRVSPSAVIDGHGTVLRMKGLRTRWTERMFRRLCTRLSRLCSPFREIDGFRIMIESDEFPRYSGELRPDFLERGPYRIEASFDGDRSIELSVNDGRPERHTWTEGEELRCGPVRARIFGFDLETDAVARIGPRMEVRAWLREWSGVSVYRDGFRIWPYGEPHDDWLRLDQRRVNNPVVRLSNNQVVGFVEIARDRNPELRDQTNREGLLHNRAFDDLRRFLLFVLQVLEEGRQVVRHPAGAAHPNGGSRNGHTGPVAGLGDSSDKRLVENLWELAAAGQAAALQSVALRLLLEQTRHRAVVLRDAVGGNGTARSAVKDVIASLSMLTERLGMVAAGWPGHAMRRRVLDIRAELERARESLGPVLELLRIRMLVSVRGERLLRVEMRPESFQHLLCILAKNSIEWLGNVKDPTVRIIARARGDRCELVFADNGPGISRRLADRVFEPLFTSRDGGRGMGLAVASAIVQSHRGSIEVVARRGRRGTTIRLLLPRKRARSTVSP